MYRGGAGLDQDSAIDQVVAAGRVIAFREDSLVVGTVGNVVVDGVLLDSIPFWDPGIGVG